MATIILLYGIQLNVCNFFYFSETEPSQNNEIGKQPEVNQQTDKLKLEIGKKKNLCGEKY